MNISMRTSKINYKMLKLIINNIKKYKRKSKFYLMTIPRKLNKLMILLTNPVKSKTILIESKKTQICLKMLLIYWNKTVTNYLKKLPNRPRSLVNNKMTFLFTLLKLLTCSIKSMLKTKKSRKTYWLSENSK